MFHSSSFRSSAADVDGLTMLRHFFASLKTISRRSLSPICIASYKFNSRMGTRAISLQRLLRSELLYPSVFSARDLHSDSLILIFTPVLCAFWILSFLSENKLRKIFSLVSVAGSGTKIFFGNLRKTASSRSNGRLVAPITTTRLSPDGSPATFDFTPSTRIRNSVFNLLLPSNSVDPPRLCNNASISSKNRMEGERMWATVNKVRIAFSESPTNFDMRDDAAREKKAELHSHAMA
mmetsp:Transcript_312/g.553  ORF Transcript_312/g.553 Transcript_312/m.553 type:complete len:236 (-) Transcript_312:325-1032(-)